MVFNQILLAVEAFFWLSIDFISSGMIACTNGAYSCHRKAPTWLNLSIAVIMIDLVLLLLKYVDCRLS